MQETEHYNLKKPSAEDFYNIADQNGNMDKLDAALHGLEEGKADLDPATGKVRGDQLPDMPYVPTSRKVNGKALSADITLTAPDVGARPSTWTPTAADVGARPSSWTPTWSEVQSKPDTFTPSAHTHSPADLTSLVPISRGGTGAATAAAARAALAALAAFPPTAITISATWTGTGPWTQSIAVAGVLAAWDWRLGLHLAKITDDAARKLQEKAYGCITWCETYDGGITLTCRDKKPDVAISAVLAGEV